MEKGATAACHLLSAFQTKRITGKSGNSYYKTAVKLQSLANRSTVWARTNSKHFQGSQKEKMLSGTSVPRLCTSEKLFIT